MALQGTIDQVCDPKGTESFVAATPHGEIVVLPKVGHGYSVPKNWMPQFREVFRRLTTATSAVPAPSPTILLAPAATGAALENVGGLPLVELPVTAAGDLLAVVVSGDGGWAGIDREVAGALVAKDVPVVGLDSLRYFWRRRTPEESATDLGRIARHYLAAWQRSRLLLVGYSRGADVLPFMINRLPDELRARIAAVALLGPAHRVEFEFHVGDWLGGGEDRGLPTTPEARRLVEANVPLLCFFGEDETDTLCRDLVTPVVVSQLPGGHHFGGRYAEIAARILAAVPATPSPTPAPPSP